MLTASSSRCGNSISNPQRKYARQWVSNRSYQNAVQLILRRQRDRIKRAERGAQALVIHKVKQPVLEDRPT